MSTATTIDAEKREIAEQQSYDYRNEQEAERFAGAFTPAPWVAETINGKVGVFAGNYLVAAVGDCHSRGLEGALPDAKLIAAAPVLRDALALLVAMDECNYERDTMRRSGGFEQARAALALVEQP